MQCHYEPEVAACVAVAAAVVVNIGTLDETFLPGIRAAAKESNAASKPWVLDPVAIGAPLSYLANGAPLASPRQWRSMVNLYR